MDYNAQNTVVCVHSPLIQFATSGSYFTSYAISLKSDNPCFTHSSSQVRRRYSEFLHLRRQLADHHPNISNPPLLPPKNYFHRFSDELIEQRKFGLQKFLEQVFSVPVYLSDKSLHLFLQSSCSMSQIDEECIGDIPVPQLMDEIPANISCPFETSSNSSFEKSDKTQAVLIPELKVNGFKCEVEDSDESESGYSSPLEIKQKIFTTLRASRGISKPCLIPRRQGSLDSSPCSSVSSLDTSYCSVDSGRNRHVSFDENVTVAIVYDQLWNIGTKRIRTSA